MDDVQPSSRQLLAGPQGAHEEAAVRRLGQRRVQHVVKALQQGGCTNGSLVVQEAMAEASARTAGALPSLHGKPWCQQRKAAHLSVAHAATAPLEQHNRALRNESERHHLRQPGTFRCAAGVATVGPTAPGALPHTHSKLSITSAVVQEAFTRAAPFLTATQDPATAARPAHTPGSPGPPGGGTAPQPAPLSATGR